MLSAQTGNIQGVEDALCEALRRSLEVWPTKGVPVNPEAWLFTVARNCLRDQTRSAAYRTSAPLEASEDVATAMYLTDPEEIPDERLKLMFVCAHPAIDPGIHTPLMLQTVLGLEAEQIAIAFEVSRSAMAQRLARAKRKIQKARIPFVLPDRSCVSARLAPVLEAIYGAQAVDWQDLPGPDPLQDLATEALFLADLMVELMPEEPEVLGLAALLSYSAARRPARFSDDGVLVPLDQQESNTWNRPMIARADNLLRRAERHRQPARYQLEAAIQSVHTDRAKTGRTDWAALVQLYEGLVRLAPTLGAAVGRAVAWGHLKGPEAALACLDQISADDQQDFQPAWAARAHFLAEMGKIEDARSAFGQAIILSTNSALEKYLEQRRDALGED